MVNLLIRSLFVAKLEVKHTLESLDFHMTKRHYVNSARTKRNFEKLPQIGMLFLDFIKCLTDRRKNTRVNIGVIADIPTKVVDMIHVGQGLR